MSHIQLKHMYQDPEIDFSTALKSAVQVVILKGNVSLSNLMEAARGYAHQTHLYTREEEF